MEEARRRMKDWVISAGTRNPEADLNILDDVSNSLCRIADSAEFIRNVHGDPEWVNGATEAVTIVSRFMSEANVDVEFYERAKRIQETHRQEGGLDKEHSHVISAMVEAMEHEGVDLSNSEKQKLINLQELDVKKAFSIIQEKESSVVAAQSWMELPPEAEKLRWIGLLPSRTIHGRTQYSIPTAGSALSTQLLRCVESRPLRQRIWEAASSKSDATKRKEEDVNELVEIRRELSRIRGYRDWNEYAQRESILRPYGGPRAVRAFLESLWLELQPGLVRELDVLKAINGGSRVEAWDIDFLIEKWKNQNRKSISSIQHIQSHLTFQRIMAGGQKVLRRLFDVDVQFDSKAGRLWHPDAFRLSLRRGSGGVFAHLYVDPYQRETKSVQSAQFTIAGSKLLPDRSRQIPQTGLVLSIPPDPTIPLPIAVAQTFFHELGHASHSLLSETNLQHFSGSRGAIDFVEFPSHLFEYFATEPECLREMIGSSIHESYLLDYAENRNPFAHIEVAQQLTYAMLDQVYYATGSPDNLADLLPKTADQSSIDILSLLKPSSTACFEHLIHYGGSYYCYLLCRAVAAHVWDASFRPNPWDRDAGRRLEMFLKSGSVDQSLASIYSIIPHVPTRSETPVSTDALLADLRRCSALHR